MLTLVVGGAASGKSAYAECLVLQTALPRYYLATMQVWDAECAARVEKHRRMRAEKQFETLECPLHLGTVHLPARGTALLDGCNIHTCAGVYGTVYGRVRSYDQCVCICDRDAFNKGN